MLTPSQLGRICDVCTAIGNEAGDDTGFVSMRALLSRFQAELFFRPLLVEGMLASLQDAATTSYSGKRWAVLVDSDRYPVKAQAVALEDSGQPLPSRLRNTIAHELVHSLAFRPTEFGVELTSEHAMNPALLVEAIEKETERLSPLLLLSERALRKVLGAKAEPLALTDLLNVRRDFGVSRYVLINRLRLLNLTDPSGLLAMEGLRNLAVGLGEWTKEDKPILRKWPLFINFDRNIIPSFLHKLLDGQDRAPLESLLPECSFAASRGGNFSATLVTDAGTRAVPSREKMNVQVEAELHEMKHGREFLFLIRKW